MKVAGIDFSFSEVDVVLIDDETGAATWERFYVHASRGAFVAARRVRERMPTRGWWRDDSGVVLVAIEEPWSRQFQTLKHMMRIQGAIVSTLPPELECWELSPQEWKKTIGLSANAAKAQVRVEVERRLGGACEGWPQDAIDAYAIAAAARRKWNQPAQESAA